LAEQAHLSYFKRMRVGTVGTAQITPPLPGKHVSVADDQPKDEVSPVGTLGGELNVELTAWIDYDLLISITFRFLVNVNIGF